MYALSLKVYQHLWIVGKIKVITIVYVAKYSFKFLNMC